MKFLGLVIVEPPEGETMSSDELQQFKLTCREGDNEVRATGNLCFELNAESGISLRRIESQIDISNQRPGTSRPDRLFLLNARDLNEAIRLMSIHPALSHGRVELYRIENAGD